MVGRSRILNAILLKRTVNVDGNSLSLSRYCESGEFGLGIIWRQGFDRPKTLG